MRSALKSARGFELLVGPRLKELILDHLISGEAVFPGAAHLEFSLAAARGLIGWTERSDHVGPCVVLSDVTFEQVCVIDKEYAQ